MIIRLDAPMVTGSDWQLSASAFLFWVEGIGCFFVSDGKTIDVELIEGTDPAEASVYLTGTALSALLLQLRSLVLHACAVSRDGQPFALCGESGAGKSTLATALCQAGWSFVSDDVSRVEPDAEDGPKQLPCSGTFWPHRLNGVTTGILTIRFSKTGSLDRRTLICRLIRSE